MSVGYICHKLDDPTFFAWLLCSLRMEQDAHPQALFCGA
jgi:hypothetical protein